MFDSIVQSKYCAKSAQIPIMRYAFHVIMWALAKIHQVIDWQIRVNILYFVGNDL